MANLQKDPNPPASLLDGNNNVTTLQHNRIVDRLGGETSLTGNRALATDVNGDMVVSSVTDTELGYLSGALSNIQTQLNGKAASSHTHTLADITDDGALAAKNTVGTTDIDDNSITDNKIAAHTSTKITITAKGQLNAGLVYNDQNNNLGAFYLDLAQIATPANPAAGTRRVFVDNADGKLKVRTSAGTSVSLEEQGGGGGAPTDAEYWVNTKHASLSAEKLQKLVIKTADETVTNSIVLQNDDELFVALEANKRYAFRFLIFHTGPTIADLDTTFVGPSGAVGNFNTDGEQTTTNALGTEKLIATSNSTRQLSGSGYIKTGTTAGNLQFQWAQNVADAGNTVVQEGSWLMVYEA